MLFVQMDIDHSFCFRNIQENTNQKRQEFWIGTLVDDYNFLMSEELICRCKVRLILSFDFQSVSFGAFQGSLAEPFTSLNDLSVHHVSHNEFEKQYGELSDWCEKIYQTITKVPSNALTRYLRQVIRLHSPLILSLRNISFRNIMKNYMNKV